MKNAKVKAIGKGFNTAVGIVEERIVKTLDGEDLEVKKLSNGSYHVWGWLNAKEAAERCGAPSVNKNGNKTDTRYRWDTLLRTKYKKEVDEYENSKSNSKDFNTVTGIVLDIYVKTLKGEFINVKKLSNGSYYVRGELNAKEAAARCGAPTVNKDGNKTDTRYRWDKLFSNN